MAKRRTRKGAGRAERRQISSSELRAAGARPRAAVRVGAAALLVAAVALAFAPVYGNGYVSFDDPRYVVRNPAVQQGVDGELVRWALTSRHAYNWHPLTWLSHAVDYSLFGEVWGAHHAVSVGLHAASAVLLLAFLVAATGRFWLAFAVAALFALHPLRVESVAWLSERKDTLSAALFFATLLAYVHYARRPGVLRWAGWTALALLGLMAKPMLVTLPLVLLLVDVWPLDRWRPLGVGDVSRVPTPLHDRRPRIEPASPARLVVEKLPLILAVVGSIRLTLWAQQPVVQDLEQFPLAARLENAAVSVVRYLGKLAWPADLGVFYPHPGAAGWSAGVVVLAIGLLAAVSALVWWRRRTRPEVTVGWLWFLGMLVPVLGLVQVGIQSMADRYTYLPSVGVLVALVWLAATRWPGRRIAAVAVLLCVPLAALTLRQARHWSDDVALFRHTLEATDGSFWAHYNLGLALQREGNAIGAREQFEAALERQPDNVEAMRNLAHLLDDQDVPGVDADRARALFERAAALRPDDPFAQIDVARTRSEAGDPAGALDAARRALASRPDEPSWIALEGRALVQLRRFAEAEPVLRRAAELQPDEAEAWNALGVAVAQQGRFGEALPLFERALELEPGHGEAARNLEAARRLAETDP
ncbi:MAG: tetratricopeptide repeat protein [Acidobacteria bacterium]|nr:MAG: tetratricopeptide repeat protein [Acidobacteriota bacterium]REK08339.1 MAG: tetratricopeptide repeat protein [Acidobacteriota bacterium]